MSAAAVERALTLWQPYAWAVAHGGKVIENRPLPPPDNLVGRRLAIHAAASWVPMREAGDAGRIFASTGMQVPNSKSLVRSAVVAVVTIAGVIDTRTPRPNRANATRHSNSKGLRALGIACFEDDPAEVAAGIAQVQCHPWWLGPVGLVLTDVVAIEPVRVDSRDGFHRGYWTMSADVAAEVARRAALGGTGA